VSLFMALVVEDDSLQREVLADVLKREGLEVIECTTAEAAELVLATTGLELCALVTDVHLDGEMTGIELAAYAKKKYPALNVIVMSGRDTRPCRATRSFCRSRSGRPSLSRPSMAGGYRWRPERHAGVRGRLEGTTELPRCKIKSRLVTPSHPLDQLIELGQK
jgi:CheY-like chemotaxis protein